MIPFLDLVNFSRGFNYGSLTMTNGRFTVSVECARSFTRSKLSNLLLSLRFQKVMDILHEWRLIFGAKVSFSSFVMDQETIEAREGSCIRNTTLLSNSSGLEQQYTMNCCER